MIIDSPYNPPKITPPSFHPRVMLTKKDFERIRRNITNTECAKESALWHKLCDEDFST